MELTEKWIPRELMPGMADQSRTPYGRGGREEAVERRSVVVVDDVVAVVVVDVVEFRCRLPISINSNRVCPYI